jgi:hypothetical protein
MQSLWQDDSSMPSKLCKMSNHMPISIGVLTKQSFMSIIHRITIHRRISYNPGFVAFRSIPQFPRKGDVAGRGGLSTKSWSSLF